MIWPMIRPAATFVHALSATLLIVFAGYVPLFAQQEVKGEAILKHPAGQLAIKAAGLLKAGKVDEAIALGPKARQDEWKKEPAEDRKGLGERMQSRAPDAAAYSDAIRRNGLLSINEDSAVLRAEMGKGDAAIAYFEREGNAWRISNGPMVIAGAASPSEETRIEGDDLLKHPVARLATEYVELVHAGKIDDAMRRLASTEAQEQWKAEPASERAASLDFRKRTLPTPAEFKSLLPTGVLIVEDGERGMLNVIRKEQRSSKPGTVEYSSTTVAIPFVLENGAWKLAR